MRFGLAALTAAMLASACGDCASSPLRERGFQDVFMRVCMGSPDGMDATVLRVQAMRHTSLGVDAKAGRPVRRGAWMVDGAYGPYEVDVAQYVGSEGVMKTCSVVVPEGGMDGLKETLARALATKATYAGKDAVAGDVEVWDLKDRSVTLSVAPTRRPGASATLVGISKR